MITLATFGGGCFWCLDTIFRRTKGITRVRSGYSGGSTEDPTYESLHAHDTGHTESVQVEFDTGVISYDILLQIFWTSHNPTTLNRDGANVGSEYRSIIFYHNDEQKVQAEHSRETYAVEIWHDPIVTEIIPFEKFYDAEDYHQDFYSKQPTHPYCQIVINPKLAKFTEKFADYLRD